jgi:hypothetical protein
MQKIKTTLWLCLLAATVLAQPNIGGRPFSEKYAEYLTPQDLLPIHLAPKPEKEQFEKPTVANQVAVGIRMGLDLSNSGLWEQLPNGDRIWRLIVKAEGALGLVALYDRFIIPQGAVLYLSNPDKSVIWGGFTSKNNPDPASGYSTAMIAGETIVFEYFEPKAVRGMGQISIQYLSYFYHVSVKNDSEYQRQQYKTFAAKQFGNSASCNINVNCPTNIGANWQREKRAVAKILIFNVSGGAGFCSGSLINNTALDEKAYFYSAFHCQNGSSAVNYDQTQFHFNYESPGCSNQDVVPDIVTGAQLRMTLREADTWLMELKSLPPNPFFAGWNREDKSPGVCIGISHPAGDIKKITEFSPAFSSPAVNIGGYVVPDNSHWGMNISKGFSEGGSSGSPLFGQSSKLIHGTLHGGSGNCQNNVASGSSYYGKFSWAWNNGGSSSSRLRDWLDPLNKQFTELPSLDPTEANPNVLISEVASGEIEGKTVRFIEIYNAHPERKIRLSGLSLQRLIDGNPANSVTISLPAFDLVPGETYLIANAEFDAAWGLPKPNLLSSQLGDGNDVYLLVSVSRPDTYGVSGQNGTGQFWDYASKVVSRRSHVIRPNNGNFTSLNFSEWEVKPLSLQNISPGRHAATQPQTDLTLSQILNPQENSLICDQKIAPIVVVSNLGKNQISAYRVHVTLNNKTLTFNSTRALAPDTDETLDFSSQDQFFDVNLGQKIELKTRVLITSGDADQVAANDSANISVNLSQKEGVFLVVETQTDNAPNETSWEILSENKVIYSQDFAGLSPNTLYTSRLCLDTALCYTLRINDKGANGIAAPGFVRATLEATLEPLVPNASFSSSRNANFCMIAPPQAPSNCQAYPIPGNIIRFEWKDNSPLENGFIVQRQFTELVPAVWEDLVEVPANTTSYQDILSINQAKRKVTYRVAAFRNSQDKRRVFSKFCELNGEVLSLDEHEPNPLNIYPNPTQNLINLSWTEPKQAQFYLMDILGKVVMQAELIPNSGTIQLDLSHLASGIYTLKVQSDSKTITAKVVKE